MKRIFVPSSHLDAKRTHAYNDERKGLRDRGLRPQCSSVVSVNSEVQPKPLDRNDEPHSERTTTPREDSEAP
jgi:hypothetical protein